MGHLLYDADAALSKGAPPTKMPGMVTLAGKLGAPAKPLMAPSTLPPRPAIDTPPLPSLESLGYASIPTKAAYGVQGGESYLLGKKHGPQFAEQPSAVCKDIDWDTDAD